MGLYPEPATATAELVERAAEAAAAAHRAAEGAFAAASALRALLPGRAGAARDRVAELLLEAARIWTVEVEAPPPLSKPYSTVGNEFLHVAEEAWFRAAKELGLGR